MEDRLSGIGDEGVIVDSVGSVERRGLAHRVEDRSGGAPHGSAERVVVEDVPERGDGARAFDLRQEFSRPLPLSLAAALDPLRQVGRGHARGGPHAPREGLRLGVAPLARRDLTKAAGELYLAELFGTSFGL